jgi:REP element-mobilizing transposase RayT
MSSSYKLYKTDDLYFLTFRIVGWVDLFTRQIYRDIVIESFKYCQKNKELQIFAYVIMSNHIHIVARTENGNLSDIVRDFKSYTCKEFLKISDSNLESRRDWMNLVFKYHGKFKNKQINQVWTNDNHAEQLFSEKFIEQKINYIHENPVRAGIVTKPEEYLYSSARNYAELDYVLDVIRI